MSPKSRTQDDGPVRREKVQRRWGWWLAAGGIVALVLTVVVINQSRVPDQQDRLSPVRDDAKAALRALAEHDLAAMEEQLSSYRGRTDFAYYFSAQTTPRLLGDALASVAGDDTTFEPGVDPDQYELALTDLAGTLALATHGIEDRALPPSWTSDFIAATTTPQTLHLPSSDPTSDAATQRADQDMANKQNLLLLLSRGYWSTDFLKAVTTAYWDLDHANDYDGWSEPTITDARYAPSPNDAYLTDGVLALTAALTANPTASLWAFTDFQPGTQDISYDDSENPIGNFTHYLLFEHQFPTTTDDKSVGMTAILTALSSAIDADPVPIGPRTSSETSTPAADALTLQGLAKSLRQDSGCSWNPVDYGHCAIAAVQALLTWVQRWGHSVLDILSLATFAPPPFQAVGVSAAVVNATWYAVDGDYTKAGLSLAVAVPGLAFTKVAASVKGGVSAEKGAEAALQVEKAAQESTIVAKIAQSWRSQPWRDCSAVGPGGLTLRLNPRWTRQQQRAAIAKVEAYYEAAQQGLLRKTIAQRERSAAIRYRNAGGTVRDGQDVDHTIDLQLGGSDDLTNLMPLDATVNRSLGIQVASQLKDIAVGTLITAAAIC